MVQFYPWFNFYFLLFLGMVVCDNEFETKENKNSTKDKIEPQQRKRSKVYFIIPTATFMPIPSMRSIWFADFVRGIS